MLEKLSTTQHDRIYFLGSTEKKDVARIMSQSDILVHPSTHHEGFPNVLLEAGASGCAVIATNMGGTKEIILDKVTGIMVEPKAANIAKALRKLIQDAQLRQELSSNLRKHIQSNFEWKYIAKEFKKLVEEKLIT